MPQNPKENLIALLKELFQLDKTDLDFGIYRILNLRSRDVEKFIAEVLPQKLESVKSKLVQRATTEIKVDLDAITTELKTSYGEDFNTKVDQFGQITLFKEKYERYSELKNQFNATRVSEELENDVYNELYRFFERYYEDGDFVTKPRAGDKTYMIPYDGEEVKLYWANYDQYYIKTGENFKNYLFNNNEDDENKIIVEFRIKDVETSVNNNQTQKGRLFIPTGEYFEWNNDEKKLSIFFYYKVPSEEEKQTWGNKQSVKKDNKGINEKLIIALDEKINATGNAQLILFWNKERTVNKKSVKVFEYHLNRYTSLNKFDYFIHKNLKKFLTRELDYFLKNEILSINFLNPEWKEEDVHEAIKLNVIKASVIKELADIIIIFLSELEDFQRRLFEKKKFVVQNEYVMTLDMIPEEVFNEVVESIINDAEKKQIKEWVELGFIESEEMTLEEINANKGLVIDTKHLRSELKFKLLDAIVNIDEKTNGLLINSENWQGVNNVINKYRNKVKTIYLDPPYNTKANEIIYKNNYKHGTWISLIENRLVISNNLMNSDGTIVIAIDASEQERLGLLLDTLYPNNSKTCITVIHNPGGKQGDNFALTHEYAYFIYPSNGKQIALENREETADIRNFMNTAKGNTTDYLRTSGANCFYPIIIKDNEVIDFGNVCEDDFHPEPNVINDDDTIEVYPIDADGVERKWVFARQTVEEIIDELKPKYNIRRGIWEIERTKAELNYKTVWTEKKYSAKTYGTQVLKNINGTFNTKFSFPKSIHLVEECLKAATNEDKTSIILDYFGGSGTTGHAVINFNKNDEGSNRKFILMEMGEYFESVLMRRLKKVMYSADWKDGKVKDRTNLDGYSTILNYLKLEQYEDALNNIEFNEFEPDLEFEDRIKYVFRDSVENSASIMKFDKIFDPFNYQLEVLQQNERKLQTVDLVTTFNFLLGIILNKIKTEIHQNKIYRIITGKKNEQEYFIVWRKFDNTLQLDNEREWIRGLSYYNDNQKKYCNADNAFGAESIEAEFKRLMFEEVR